VGGERSTLCLPATLAAPTSESWRKLTIPVGDVYTSLFQRAVDTGTLIGFGEVKPTADVTEGGLVVTPNENKRREQALRALAAKLPPPGTNVVIVSHKPNIMDAFGKDWFDLREGEASLFKPRAKAAPLSLSACGLRSGASWREARIE
jgi:hypothetical protein